ncbi:13091_t:CDS:2 [Ambispora gerdemannii]|uniref:13091_t:CDS:1 n=1 Tax=Ambispora gerdemannii TaxID=144530 RepID=A0A9N9C1F2_9GLOM|nr:13091_t:CDS:2 [Ambispora gerdemannii]
MALSRSSSPAPSFELDLNKLNSSNSETESSTTTFHLIITKNIRKNLNNIFSGQAEETISTSTGLTNEEDAIFVKMWANN